MKKMTQLQNLMNDISEWSDATFGDGQRNPAIAYHLKKEIDELIEALNKANALGTDNSVGIGEFGRHLSKTKMEYADCFMLLLDSAHHFGLSADELIMVTRAKLEINKTRKWGKPDTNGVVEHIEDKLTKEEYLKQVENSKYEVMKMTSPYDKNLKR